MSRAVSRRRFTLAAAALAAPVILPRASLGNDVKVDLVHLFSGAEHPIQKVIKAFNDKDTGVTVVSRQDGTTYETITQKAMSAIAAGRGPAMMTTGWKLGDFARKTLGAQDFRQIFGARPHRGAARQVPPAGPAAGRDRRRADRPAVVDEHARPLHQPVAVDRGGPRSGGRAQDRPGALSHGAPAPGEDRQAGPLLRGQRMAAAGLHPECRRRRDRRRRQAGDGQRRRREGHRGLRPAAP